MFEKSFKGVIEVYNEEFYVDTISGEGIDRVLKKIDPLICKMASKTYIPGYAFDDIRQELVIIAIDGIKSYNPEKDVKLSTFLHIHLRNKLISRLRSENKMSNDAFGFSDEDDGSSKIRRAREELNFSQCAPLHEEEGLLFEHSISEDDGLYNFKNSNYDDVNFEMSLKKLFDRLDDVTFKIIELVYFKDYSIKDAAEEVGLSGWAASMRLKSLSRKKYFKDIFNQD